MSACQHRTPLPTPSSPALATHPAFLDTLEERTFRYFWDLADPRTGLIPDRAPTRSFASISATGFGLTAYPIGIERGYITREEGRGRVLATLRFLAGARQDTAAVGPIGYRGLFYHFLAPETGARFEQVELSTIDTALLLAGVLFCQSYFDRTTSEEIAIRAAAESLYARADWQWASVRPPAISHGWSPEEGFLPYDWRGYNEAMIVYVLALGSATHPVTPEAWSAWTSAYKWGTFEGQEHLGFAPLFGHQYTHVWIDFRGIRDDAMRARGIDYFENSRRAVLAQHAYAVRNPDGWAGYGPDLWGLTASDGPVNQEFQIDGRARQFNTYWARGASFTHVQDDGTISPTAAGGSIVFAPELVVPTLLAMRMQFGDNLFAKYGFVDALNPTLKLAVPVQHGHVDPAAGWFDIDYLGIDQGPIIAMVENYRTELVWRTMRKNPHVVRGLRAAGFSGGWLDSLQAVR
ncbi:MAG TPA: glucoamylase family protein [Candidatus Udaeobacter sp.]|nr:glucoamylase family protein [Candidatus Udaeobacter sp.]